MTKVKICGITNLDDALNAVACGADALGFNFYQESPRYVSADVAKSIIQQLPSEIEKVGVFVNEDLDSILATASKAKLTALQLHGDESPEFVNELRSRIDMEVIKAFRVSNSFAVEEPLRYRVESVMLDGFASGLHGGTGRTFDWDIARTFSQSAQRLYLAGGLTPENVAAAISTVRPYAVDACSSLESKPGRKDASRVEQFITEAKRHG